MHATVSFHGATNLSNFKLEGRILKRRLHVAPFEMPQIPALGRTSALRILFGQTAKCRGVLPDLVQKVIDIVSGLT